MSNLNHEVKLLDIQLNGTESNDKPNQEDKANLLEFILFVKDNFFKDGKFKINWWGLITNFKVAGILAKAMPAIIKAIRRWLGL